MSVSPDDGGLAFGGERYEAVPLTDGTTQELAVKYPGMSMRDYFAVHAPQDIAWLKANTTSEDSARVSSLWAYAWADAMLEARKR